MKGYSERKRQTERQAGRQTAIYEYRSADRRMDGFKNRLLDRQIDIQTERLYASCQLF